MLVSIANSQIRKEKNCCEIQAITLGTFKHNQHKAPAEHSMFTALRDVFVDLVFTDI